MRTLVVSMILLASAFAQANMPWHCEDDENMSGTSVDITRFESDAAVGSASWDGPGDSGGVIQGINLEVGVDGANLRYTAKDSQDSFDLTIYDASGLEETGKRYRAYFSGTQDGSAPVSIGVTCTLTDDHAQ